MTLPKEEGDSQTTEWRPAPWTGLQQEESLVLEAGRRKWPQA